MRKLPYASYSSPSEGRQTENHNYRKLTNLSHGPQPCLTQWNYKPCHVGPPKMVESPRWSWWRVLTKRGPLEKGMANHFSILALRTPWTVWKGKKIGHWKMLQLDVYIIVHVRKHMVKWSELKDTMSNSGMDARKGGDSLSLVTLHITGIQFFF